MTHKPWSLRECCDHFTRSGIPAITIWRNVLENLELAEARKMLADHPLRVTSLCRGGFFPHIDPGKREESIDDNKRAVDEAAALGAPMVVLVCGADPCQSLEESRQQIRDGIAAVLPHARACGVKLAVEPLHPMYAGDRSAINTLAQANDLCQELDSPEVGVAVDVYHLWWDPRLEEEIERCGRLKKLFAFHVCDWKTPTTDLLLDRGLMGEGCIPLKKIRSLVEATGFSSDIEVEIFSDHHWARDQKTYLEEIKSAYLNHC